MKIQYGNIHIMNTHRILDKDKVAVYTKDSKSSRCGQHIHHVDKAIVRVV